MKSKEEEFITISMSDYRRLVKDSRWLYALEAAGVDNWPGIEEAIRINTREEWQDA